jgi:hypothetical protein
VAWRSKKTVVFLVVMIGVFAVVYANGQHRSPSAPAPTPGPGAAHPPVAASANEIWIIGRGAIEQMLHNGASSALIRRAFDNDHTFVYGEGPGTPYSSSQIGVPTITFESYQTIVQAFRNGTLPGDYKAVLYDNEHWSKTPLNEQQHPARYMALVGHLLHRRGMLYIATPAPDLMWAVSKPADSYNAFVKSGVPAAAARYADVLDLQAQVRETDLPDYSSFVRTAATQARAANPRIKVVIGIRTNPGATAMLAAYRATASMGEGYWLNENGNPSPAVYLLQQLYRN